MHWIYCSIYEKLHICWLCWNFWKELLPYLAISFKIMFSYSHYFGKFLHFIIFWLMCSHSTALRCWYSIPRLYLCTYYLCEFMHIILRYTVAYLAAQYAETARTKYRASGWSSSSICLSIVWYLPFSWLYCRVSPCLFYGWVIWSQVQSPCFPILFKFTLLVIA